MLTLGDDSNVIFFLSMHHVHTYYILKLKTNPVKQILKLCEVLSSFPIQMQYKIDPFNEVHVSSACS